MKDFSFTIVLPVRNGGEHLKQCVSSVLAQNLVDFELVVLENCSDDGSHEWLAEISDPRVRIYPSASPLSIEDNWARAVGVPKNEFVTFVGHGDVLDPDYLDVMTALIAANPDAGLYHAHFRFIDTQGRVLGSCRPMPPRETAAQFYQAFLQFQRDANGTGYVMRSRDFERVDGFPHFHKMLHADHALWINMVRASYIVTAPQECFSYRRHASSTSASALWRDHLKAIWQLSAFMDQVEGWNDEMKRVTQSYAPSYFFTLCTNWYSNAVVYATKRNQRIQPEIIEEFAAVLEQVDPQEVERFRNLKSLHIRHLINTHWWGRMAYILYILIHYGKSDLPSGSSPGNQKTT